MVSPACSEGPETGAALLFGSTQYSPHQLTGSQNYVPPLHRDCPGCGQQVTDRARAGRPIHVEHGHAPGCTRLATNQAAEERNASSGWRD